MSGPAQVSPQSHMPPHAGEEPTCPGGCGVLGCSSLPCPPAEPRGKPSSVLPSHGKASLLGCTACILHRPFCLAARISTGHQRFCSPHNATGARAAQQHRPHTEGMRIEQAASRGAALRWQGLAAQSQHPHCCRWFVARSTLLCTRVWGAKHIWFCNDDLAGTQTCSEHAPVVTKL